MIWSKIEIPFPDSCYHPYYYSDSKEIKMPFYWKSWTPLPETPKRILQIVSSANETNRDPGRLYYFAYGSKTYMGIMQEVICNTLMFADFLMLYIQTLMYSVLYDWLSFHISSHGSRLLNIANFMGCSCSVSKQSKNCITS